MIEDYNELEPLSSLTTKAIKDFEKGIAETALRELTDIIIEYIKVRKNFGLMPSFKQDEGIRFGRYFIDESYIHLEKIMKICIKESDPDIMDLMFYLNMIIGNESITLQDSDTFKKVIRFYLYFSHRLEDDFIYTILLNSGRLELKTRYDLEKEKEDIDYIKGSESILKEIADYYRDLTKILMDKQTRFAITSLEKHLEMNNGMDRLRYNTAEFQLKMKLRELKPESNEYQKIESELGIIEEKKKVSGRLKFNLVSYKIFSCFFGTKITPLFESLTLE